MDAMAAIFGAKVDGLSTRGQSCGNAGTQPGGLQVLAPTPWQSTVAAAPPAWAVASLAHYISQGRIGVVETDEFARKRQQLEQLKTDLENNLGASRVQWTTAIREGHSSNQERTAFINSYEAQCSRLRELFGEKWQLERELRSIQ
jgi:hypothetical protein